MMTWRMFATWGPNALPRCRPLPERTRKRRVQGLVGASTYQLVNDLTTKLAQLLEPPGVVVRQSVVVESQ